MAKDDDGISSKVSANSPWKTGTVLIATAPRMQPRQTMSMPPPTIEADESLLVCSFDGSARAKERADNTVNIDIRMDDHSCCV